MQSVFSGLLEQLPDYFSLFAFSAFQIKKLYKIRNTLTVIQTM
jgi:hypothetical protein